MFYLSYYFTISMTPESHIPENPGPKSALEVAIADAEKIFEDMKLYSCSRYNKYVSPKPTPTRVTDMLHQMFLAFCRYITTKDTSLLDRIEIIIGNFVDQHGEIRPDLALVPDDLTVLSEMQEISRLMNKRIVVIARNRQKRTRSSIVPTLNPRS